MKMGCALRVLQGILRAGGEDVPENESPGRQPEPAAVTQITLDEGLQLSLLNCAAELVTFALEPEIEFPALTHRLGRMDQALGLWDAVGHFWTHLSAPERSWAAPQSVRNVLTFMR